MQVSSQCLIAMRHRISAGRAEGNVMVRLDECDHHA